MKYALKTGFIGGSIGAIVLALITYAMQAAGKGEPPFVSTYRATIGMHPACCAHPVYHQRRYLGFDFYLDGKTSHSFKRNFIRIASEFMALDCSRRCAWQTII